MNTTKIKKHPLGQLFFYLSFILIIPMLWYGIEINWYRRMKQKIGDKMFDIWQQNQKIPLIWQKLNEFLQLDYPIQFDADFYQNITNYQKALEYVWDNLQKQNFSFSVEQLKTLIKFSDFLTRTKQAITEYNSDVVLFNESLTHWPSNVVGIHLKLTPIHLVYLV